MLVPGPAVADDVPLSGTTAQPAEEIGPNGPAAQVVPRRTLDPAAEEAGKRRAEAQRPAGPPSSAEPLAAVFNGLNRPASRNDRLAARHHRRHRPVALPGQSRS